ncbi:hypothetical protein BAUCODRAFT_320095 [Baudoinia panamericana UAMH 10762]|uniref:Uncharacterized protein n=1 Tax=Baudoinia panamericana (strain UAMH 10762) TaxID=717646 RepID=M2MYA3_BAUPA|nr:uncharacterized protein BAUCODRAFT_320095 [Baudoinia panamericana UAMH 10762]EMC91270.1 hypothetical protein BAUCODRAFT_320095 [Baudoinia panamericana UAMH 10762]
MLRSVMACPSAQLANMEVPRHRPFSRSRTVSGDSTASSSSTVSIITYPEPPTRPPAAYLTELEISSAPMEQCHKDLAIMHLRRLSRIAWEDDNVHDKDALPQYTTKEAAREQLARMTVIVREYRAAGERAKRDEQEAGFEGDGEDMFSESMVHDLTDAAFFVSGRRGTFNQPVFANPLSIGREQEVAAFMQEVQAESVDDVIELWNLPQYATPLPDGPHCAGEDLGAGIDWTAKVLKGSVSEDNLIAGLVRFKARAGVRAPVAVGVPPSTDPLMDRKRRTEILLQRGASRTDMSWPPPPPRRSRAPSLSKLRDVDWEDVMGSG